VHFLGFRRDVPSLLRAADVVLLPSEQEGLPRCLLEAMACGVPCVASDIRGSRDLLEGGCGLLFPVGDAKRLADAAAQVLSSHDLARQLAARASAKVKDYDVRHVIALHERLYAAALASAAGAHPAALTPA
jgi:glycosyltransferase involved in cell wall biosynthesis